LFIQEVLSRCLLYLFPLARKKDATPIGAIWGTIYFFIPDNTPPTTGNFFYIFVQIKISL
jgi:hypothetical protein